MRVSEKGGNLRAMLDLKRIGLFTRDAEQDYRVESMTRLFARAGIELVHNAVRPDPELDLVMSLGGDGTVLRALRTHPGVPVLAVNFGNVGFLTQCDREDLDRVLVRLLADDYHVEERLTLQVEHDDVTSACINEVVIKGATHMVSVRISVNGRVVHTPRGDGVIVGTPTGSSAYLLSTGAPLVTPDVDCIVLKPLNEYSFSSRSIILPGSAEVQLDIEAGREDDVGLIIDGGNRIRVDAGDRVVVRRAAMPARLVYFESDYFFRNLRERLRW